MGKFPTVIIAKLELIYLETFESIKNSDSRFLKMNRLDSDSIIFLTISKLNFKNTAQHPLRQII